ncbi:MAG: hypothetical protein AB1610_11695 [Nitrospirota bacterium]
MKEKTEKFYIDIVDRDIENCQHIKNKVMNLVAFPDKQEPKLYEPSLMVNFMAGVFWIFKLGKENALPSKSSTIGGIR